MRECRTEVSCTADLREVLRTIVGNDGIAGPEQIASRPSPYCLSANDAALLVMPSSTEQVSAVLRACHAARHAVVPQGGLTGLVRGTACTGTEIALSLTRMNRIESVDSIERKMVAEAGVTLAAAHAAASDRELELGVDIGSRGSCTIGGMVATNAGGVRVTRHGMMRRQILGLEAVLADGSVVSHLRGLLKDNTGYDWTQLLVGSEGTLAVVTRVVMQLHPRATDSATALLTFEDLENAVAAVHSLERQLGPALVCCEAMSAHYVHEVVKRLSLAGAPRHEGSDAVYLLVEIETFGSLAAGRVLEEVLLEVSNTRPVGDVFIAKSEQERRSWWRIREAAEILQRDAADSWSFDVSLPRIEWARYIDRVTSRIGVERGCTIYSFGHIADGNLHVLVTSDDADHERTERVEAAVYGELPAGAASISAEHGIGVEKIHWLAHSRTKEELALMHRLKQALDPLGILNPGTLRIPSAGNVE